MISVIIAIENLVSVKSDSKVSAINRKIDAVSRPLIGLLLFRYRSEALIECGFNLEAS